MAGIETGGVVESYKRFNKLTRNGALGIAVVGAFVYPPIVAPALLSAIIDQGQNMAIEKYQGWRQKGGHIFP